MTLQEKKDEIFQQKCKSKTPRNVRLRKMEKDSLFAQVNVRFILYSQSNKVQ